MQSHARGPSTKFFDKFHQDFHALSFRSAGSYSGSTRIWRFFEVANVSWATSSAGQVCFLSCKVACPGRQTRYYPSSFLLLVANLAPTGKALVTRSDALVTSSLLAPSSKATSP